MNKFRELSVVVQGGSGCLFQPCSEEYTYVLTAKHNIKNADRISITRQVLTKEDVIHTESFNVLGEPYLHPNDEIDAAILKIEKVRGLPYLLRIDSPLINKEGYYVCGHPDSRNEKDSYRANKITVINKKNYGYIEAEAEKAITYDEVVGQSGGGVLKFLDGIHYITGIQKKMSADDDKEVLGRIDFMPLSFFDEIVTQFSDELVEIVPSFIQTFEELKEFIYSLEDLAVSTKTLVQSELRAIAADLCDEFSPEKLIDKYNEKLLIKGELPHNIYNTKFWIGFLELLVINQVHSGEKLKFDDIDRIKKKSTIFFGSVDKKWTEVIKPLFLSDLSDVEKDSNVFVVTSADDMPTKTQCAPRVVENIAQVSKRQMTIHSSVIKPSEDIKVRHIYSLQKKIIDNDDSFLDATPSNISDIIENETKDII